MRVNTNRAIQAPMNEPKKHAGQQAKVKPDGRGQVMTAPASTISPKDR